MKKGDIARLPALESELETVELFVCHFKFYVKLSFLQLSSQYDSLQQAMLGAINKLELEKVCLYYSVSMASLKMSI